MLTGFIYQLNPFNICGSKVEFEDLICQPLQSNETLMQDSYGHCRRIKVPAFPSTLWERIVFWFQTHLNEKGHLEAINKLISLFYQKLLQSPPEETEKLQEFILQIDRLRALKNDYGFIHLKSGDPSFIDSRLKEIEQHAYSIFTYYHKQQVTKQEQERKKAFTLFQEHVKQQFQNLKLEHVSSLIKIRFLIIAPSQILRSLFEERIQSLHDRLDLIDDLHRQTTEMEKLHEGQFTIPYFKNHLNRLKMKLSHEVSKIGIEAEILIRSLILNYRLVPFKEEVKELLDSIKVDPDEHREGKSCAYLFQEALESEIERIKRIFNKILS